MDVTGLFVKFTKKSYYVKICTEVFVNLTNLLSARIYDARHEIYRILNLEFKLSQ